MGAEDDVRALVSYYHHTAISTRQSRVLIITITGHASTLTDLVGTIYTELLRQVT